MILNKNIETFDTYIIFFILISIYLARKTLIALLPTKIFILLKKFLDFLKIFLEKKTLELLKIIKLNKYIIKL